MIAIIFNELIFFKEVFSRTKTWKWFGIAVLAFMGNCDPLGGISGLVRSLNLDASIYNSLVWFFQSSSINPISLQLHIFSWMQKRFKSFIVKIGDKELLILDAKKQAKSGKRMPGVKWHHQNSQSSSKKEFVTAHSFECLGLAINCIGCVSCLIFLIKMIDGFKLHNRDIRTLKEKVGDLIEKYSPILSGRIVVCDAWYAAQQIINSAMNISTTIITRVGKNAVACYDPITKMGVRGRPSKYGEDIKLLSLFNTLKTIVGEVKNCSGDAQKVTFWSITLMWKPIKQKVLFVGSTDDKNRKIVLLCTDLKIDPLEIIQAYVYRSSIEHSFWLSTQFFSSWTYRFWTKLPLINENLKGDFNLHYCCDRFKRIFQGKIQAYEIFLTIGFFAHAMFLFLGLEFKNKKINENILFFRFRNRSAGASIPIMRAMFVNEYQNYIRSEHSSSELGKFLLEKHWKRTLDSPLRKVS